MRKLLTCLSFFFVIPFVAATAQVALSRLTVEGRVTPMGLDVEAPRLGWVIETEKQKVVQTAYQVQLSLTPSFEKLLWDSGEQQSDQSQWVSITQHLTPNTQHLTPNTQHLTPNT